PAHPATPKSPADPAMSASPLVLLQEGSGRPSFWFHPLGGRVLCYAGLAHHLAGRPLYGLEAGRSGEGLGVRLEELAGRYAEALLDAQPRGPYLLGGWSFGGLLAWETARYLEQAGREVALLALIDSRPPDPAESLPVPDDATLLPLLRAETGAAEAELPALLATVRSHLSALSEYRPSPLHCPVSLFLAERRPSGETADRAGLWRPLARGPFEVEPVPGGHFDLLEEPAVGILAAKLKRRLARIEEQPG
nr:thioesterase domain-containing protein [Acidobacteriota bacterium]